MIYVDGSLVDDNLESSLRGWAHVTLTSSKHTTSKLDWNWFMGWRGDSFSLGRVCHKNGFNMTNILKCIDK